MNPELRAGVTGGIVGSLVFHALSEAMEWLGFIPFDSMRIAALVFLRPEVALSSHGHWILGAASNILIGVFYGLVFTHVFGLQPGQRYVGRALLYSVAVDFLDLGVFGSARGLIAPIWTMDAPAIVASLLVHLGYGLGLGLVVTGFARAAAKAK